MLCSLWDVAATCRVVRHIRAVRWASGVESPVLRARSDQRWGGKFFTRPYIPRPPWLVHKVGRAGVVRARKRGKIRRTLGARSMWVNVGKARVYRWRSMHNESDQHTLVTKQKARQTFLHKNKPHLSPERYSSKSTKSALATCAPHLQIYWIALIN